MSETLSQTLSVVEGSQILSERSESKEVILRRVVALDPETSGRDFDIKGPPFSAKGFVGAGFSPP